MTSFRAETRSRQTLSFDASDNSDIEELIELDGVSLNLDDNDEYQNRYRLIRIPFESRSEHALRLESATDHASREDDSDSYGTVSEDISLGLISTDSISEEIVSTSSPNLDLETLDPIQLESPDVNVLREDLSSVDSLSVSVNNAGTFFTPYLDRARTDEYLLLEDFSSISTIGEEIVDDDSLSLEKDLDPLPLRIPSSEIPAVENHSTYSRSPETENYITLGSHRVDQFVYLRDMGSERRFQFGTNDKGSTNTATDSYVTQSGQRRTAQRLSPVSA